MFCRGIYTHKLAHTFSDRRYSESVTVPHYAADNFFLQKNSEYVKYIMKAHNSIKSQVTQPQRWAKFSHEGRRMAKGHVGRSQCQSSGRWIRRSFHPLPCGRAKTAITDAKEDIGK